MTNTAPIGHDVIYQTAPSASLITLKLRDFHREYLNSFGGSSSGEYGIDAGEAAALTARQSALVEEFTGLFYGSNLDNALLSDFANLEILPTTERIELILVSTTILELFNDTALQQFDYPENPPAFAADMHPLIATEASIEALHYIEGRIISFYQGMSDYASVVEDVLPVLQDIINHAAPVLEEHAQLNQLNYHLEEFESSQSLDISKLLNDAQMFTDLRFDGSLTQLQPALGGEPTDEGSWPIMQYAQEAVDRLIELKAMIIDSQQDYNIGNGSFISEFMSFTHKTHALLGVSGFDGHRELQDDVRSLDISTPQSAHDSLIAIDGLIDAAIEMEQAVRALLEDTRLVGDQNDNRLVTYEGDDVVKGMGDDDDIYTGAGNDKLYGHAGSDHLKGGAGNDMLRGGTGDDTLEGHSGSDNLSGAAGNDVLLGGAGNDKLRGGDGADVFALGEGNDVLRAAGGRRNLFDGDSDVFVLNTKDHGHDRIHGFELGTDKIDLVYLDVNDVEVTVGRKRTVIETGEDSSITLMNTTFGDEFSFNDLFL